MNTFLEKEVVVKSFKGYFETYNSILEELSVLWIEVCLGLFSLSCSDLNSTISLNARELLSKLSLFLAQYNRDINTDICTRYREIAKRLEEVTRHMHSLVGLSILVLNRPFI